MKKESTGGKLQIMAVIATIIEVIAIIVGAVMLFGGGEKLYGVLLCAVGGFECVLTYFILKSIGIAAEASYLNNTILINQSNQIEQIKAKISELKELTDVSNGKASEKEKSERLSEKAEKYFKDNAKNNR